MGLTRQLKRKFARDNRKREMKDLYAHVDRVTAEHQRQLRKKLYDAIGIDIVLDGRKHDE